MVVRGYRLWNTKIKVLKNLCLEQDIEYAQIITVDMKFNLSIGGFRFGFRME